MNVLVVEPGYLPYEKEILDSADHLEQMQAIVGGLIEPIYPYHEEVAIVCNEEGLINGLPFNRSVPGGYGGVFGTFFICGLGEEDFCSLRRLRRRVWHVLHLRFGRGGLLLSSARSDGALQKRV